MKITVNQLRRIIKEEVSKVMMASEGGPVGVLYNVGKELKDGTREIGTFGIQPNQREMKLYDLVDPTPADLATIEAEYKNAYASAADMKRVDKIKQCKKLNREHPMVQVFARAVDPDGVISLGLLLANELGVAYDRAGYLIDL